MYVWILFLVLESGKQLVDEYSSEQDCYDALMGTAIGYAISGYPVTLAYCEEYKVVGGTLLNTTEESKESILAEPRR